MVMVDERRRYPVSGPQLWKRLSDFYSLDWLPAVTSTRALPELRTRSAILPGGGEITEALVEEGDQFHRYVVLGGGPLPVRDFEATLRVRDVDDSACEVVWQARFEAHGLSEPDARAVIERIFRDGLDHLAQLQGTLGGARQNGSGSA